MGEQERDEAAQVAAAGGETEARQIFAPPPPPAPPMIPPPYFIQPAGWFDYTDMSYGAWAPRRIDGTVSLAIDIHHSFIVKYIRQDVPLSLAITARTQLLHYTVKAGSPATDWQDPRLGSRPWLMRDRMVAGVGREYSTSFDILNPTEGMLIQIEVHPGDDHPSRLGCNRMLAWSGGRFDLAPL